MHVVGELLARWRATPHLSMYERHLMHVVLLRSLFPLHITDHGHFMAGRIVTLSLFNSTSMSTHPYVRSQSRAGCHVALNTPAVFCRAQQHPEHSQCNLALERPDSCPQRTGNIM